MKEEILVYRSVTDDELLKEVLVTCKTRIPFFHTEAHAKSTFLSILCFWPFS